MSFTVVFTPRGSTTTSCPARTMPPAICPLKPRKSCNFGSRGIVRTIDPLHGKSQRVQIPVAGDVDGFQMRQQRRAFDTTACASKRSTTLSPFKRADGNEFHVAQHVKPRQEILNLVADFGKPLLAPVHEVHFVDGDDEVRNAEQRREVGVAARLLDDALPRVHEHDGEVRGRSAGDHVARVLHVAGRVGDDELAFAAWRNSDRRRQS